MIHVPTLASSAPGRCVMISIINGYVCTTSCEAAGARLGKDPHAPLGSLPGVSGKNNKTSAFADLPATIVDGSLKNLVVVNPISSADNTQQPRLDRLV